MTIKQIARVCHEANKAYCIEVGDLTQKSWEEAEEWQRESAIKGVEFKLENPDSSESAQHEAWLRDKISDGWKYGLIKDSEKKEHPCIVPYSDLPIEQRLKDRLFVTIVNTLK